jgi:prepilin-type N-terminal cleavage/methylation domain-containing protein
MAKKQKDKGVTLIEVLIVVLILAALAGITIPRISQSAVNAKARACEANIAILNQAIEEYYVINGVYPDMLNLITRDMNIFPDGRPMCPVTEWRYRNVLTDENRVNTNGHNH